MKIQIPTPVHKNSDASFLQSQVQKDPRTLNRFSIDQQDKIDEIKRALCIAIKNQFNRKMHSTTKGMARLMGTNMSRLTEIQTLKLDKLTINQLFRYLVRLNPHFKFQLLFKYSESKPFEPEGYKKKLILIDDEI